MMAERSRERYRMKIKLECIHLDPFPASHLVSQTYLKLVFLLVIISFGRYSVRILQFDKGYI